MISWDDINKVLSAMVPLYVAVGLGYASVKWWRIFKPDQCVAINRLNFYFIIPFFVLHFTSGVDPYCMNFRFLAGDVIAKAITGVLLALWANLWRSGSFSWAITSFSLWHFNNTLLVGVPLLGAMYGRAGEDLVVQSTVIQAVLWMPSLLFMLELRRSMSDSTTSNNIEIVVTTNENVTDDVVENKSCGVGSVMKKVGTKLARNPNCYACAVGTIWALISKRWDFEMPSIVEGSIMIMAKAGTGVAMFSIGLFMALQKKAIACGVRLCLYGMLLRFVAGPLTMAIGALILGLKSNIFRMAIIQAALPQATAAFVFAQEYGLHADVLSTAVVFGTIVSLPLLTGYYAALDVVYV